jgi:hypothetical protein
LVKVARCSASAVLIASRCAAVSAAWPEIWSSRATCASWARRISPAKRLRTGVDRRCSPRRAASIWVLLMRVSTARAFGAVGASTALGTAGFTGPPVFVGLAESPMAGASGATAVPRASFAATSGEAPPHATLRSTAPVALRPVWMPDCVPGTVVDGEPLRAGAPGESGALGWYAATEPVAIAAPLGMPPVAAAPYAAAGVPRRPRTSASLRMRPPASV